MYLVSHSVLCHCLVKQHSRNDKKKKKKLSDVSVLQSWPRWAHSVSHTRVTVERGIKFGIDQNRDAAANCWRLEPVTHAGRAALSPEIFWAFLTVCLTVFPFAFRPRIFTIGFYGKKSFISELMILECSFPLSFEKPVVLCVCSAPPVEHFLPGKSYASCPEMKNRKETPRGFLLSITIRFSPSVIMLPVDKALSTILLWTLVDTHVASLGCGSSGTGRDKSGESEGCCRFRVPVGNLRSKEWRKTVLIISSTLRCPTCHNPCETWASARRCSLKRDVRCKVQFQTTHGNADSL